MFFLLFFWYKEENVSYGCNEFGVVMFSIILNNIVGKYFEKDGFKIFIFYLVKMYFYLMLCYLL